MQLEISREQLKRAVSKLNNALSKTVLNALLEHILFEVKNKTLTLKTTDSQVCVIWETSVSCTDTFSFTLPGETLCSLVSSLEGEKVTFDYNPETKDVILTCGKYTLETISGNTENYPKLEIPVDLKEVFLPPNFDTLLESVYFSISGDSVKPDLNSLCIDVNKDSSEKINLVSTDRVRLSYASAKTAPGKHVRFVMPKSSVSKLLKLDPKVLMYDDAATKVYFKNETETEKYFFISVLTNCVYPDIYAYLNIDFKENESVLIKRHELIRLLKRISLTTENTKLGFFEFKDKKAVISSVGSATNKSKEEVSLEFKNVDMTLNNFTINLSFLLEYLTQEVEDTVSFNIVHGKCIIFDKENYRHVLSIS